MPCDMTVQQPGTWIVGLEPDDNKTVGREKHNITTRRVVIIWIDQRLIERHVGLLKEGKVVTV